jgi:DNA-directed RNA polymerase specialized sigma24 family protein
MRKKQNYVNNSRLLESLKEYLEKYKVHNKTQVSDYIGECIQSIATKLANRPNFINYPFKEEMIADGIENSLRYINNFDPSKSSNPFAYFTQIIHNAFVRRIQREKTQLYTKYKLINQRIVHDFHDVENLNVTKYGSEYSDSNMHDFIIKFEAAQEDKKERIKKYAKVSRKHNFEEIFRRIMEECDGEEQDQN